MAAMERGSLCLDGGIVSPVRESKSIGGGQGMGQKSRMISIAQNRLRPVNDPVTELLSLVHKVCGVYAMCSLHFAKPNTTCIAHYLQSINQSSTWRSLPATSRS